MVNYQEDVRFGDEMLSRLSESYRKIRNTWRFMLGVLGDFDPATRRAARRGSRRDRPATSCSGCRRSRPGCSQAYRDFEYHAIFHAMFNFFTVDLSSFYLNIQKDNLYCNRPDDPADAGASQHAVFTLLARDPAAHGPDPLLHLRGGLGLSPGPSRQGSRSSTWRAFPQVEKRLAAAWTAKRWEKIMALRDRMLKEIEAARAKKRIGDSLEAAIEIVAAGDDEKLLREQHAIFSRTILVIAALDVRAGREEKITVRKAEGRKCPRCWNWVGAAPVDPVHPELCPRCAAAVKE